ncbi:ExbD/TolR family protein [Rhodothalassium salexigens]|uniref:ExbD/TolR family protein n=1 Tax=Rhodothalassium salexigens TaxID=1086 RepID=UPI001912EA9D|nr:biopolymer transporter ExbD [Rhodothalassium salexigens]
MAGPSSPHSSGGQSRRLGNGRYRVMAEINMTPFVDVVTVLLIVFMVTAPLLTIGVPVDLPEADAQSMGEDNQPLELTIQQNGAIFLQDKEVAFDELIPRLTAIAGNDLQKRIYVRGDSNLNYGRVMEVMAAVNRAGFRKVAMVSRRPSQAR